MENIENEAGKVVSSTDKIEHVIEVIISLEDGPVKDILLDSIGQGLLLVASLFDDEGNYLEGAEPGKIDSVQVFENFFGVKITDIIAGFQGEYTEMSCSSPEYQNPDAKIMNFITGEDGSEDGSEKTEEEIQAEIKQKLSFINSVIDN